MSDFERMTDQQIMNGMWKAQVEINRLLLKRIRLHESIAIGFVIGYWASKLIIRYML